MALSRILTTATFGALLALSVANVGAQEKTVEVKGIKVDKLDIEVQKTPEVEYTGPKQKRTPRNREWLELDVQFEVAGRAVANDYLDALTIKYFIILDGKDFSGKAKKFFLTATVNHVNVPMNEEIWSSVYLSPAVIEKQVGKGNVNKSVISDYAIVIEHGEKMGFKSSRPNSARDWWNNSPEKPVEGLLLPKSKTPFRYLWWDRYAEEKPTN